MTDQRNNSDQESLFVSAELSRCTDRAECMDREEQKVLVPRLLPGNRLSADGGRALIGEFEAKL